jgi:hypothetical protein
MKKIRRVLTRHFQEDLNYKATHLTNGKECRPKYLSSMVCEMFKSAKAKVISGIELIPDSSCHGGC